ncbi:patatin-like phospholipase family protein [uncultured Brevundimonas sp.]|uniref:patatin-like phospholipase family protein n=1 Tax=uncultured Brevundimonas sp. TaxID=213418 RepID=UPI0030ED1D56|tara:strand:+ start:3077 stop:4261 length:1185 start_codon:yes stop_codon:yes gene_type:complete
MPSHPPTRPRSLASPPPAVRGEPVGFTGVRLSTSQAHEALTRAADRIAPPRRPWARDPINILAVSGGAAGGAFGAGLLVGLTRVGRRPAFAVVTGISTGALIAPFAFLGPDWDDRLADAFTGGLAQRRLSLFGLLPGRRAGLYPVAALDGLIEPFIDADLLKAVAEAHAAGRRLFVGTTDLDRQQASIWDMGAIASQGQVEGKGEAALALFRTVLAASSSLPGLFPPRLIACESDGEIYHEMHVDGGVATPLFVLPDALLRWKQVGRRLRGGRVYIIVNMVLAPAPQSTPDKAAAVAIRSFDTMLRFSYRQAISAAAAFCAGAGLPLDVASVPARSTIGNGLSFDTATMRATFDDAVESAADPDVWVAATPSPLSLADLLTWPFGGEDDEDGRK